MWVHSNALWLIRSDSPSLWRKHYASQTLQLAIVITGYIIVHSMWCCYCSDRIKVIVYKIYINYENLLICNDGKPSCIRTVLYKRYDVNYEMLTIAMIGNKIQGSAYRLNSSYVCYDIKIILSQKFMGVAWFEKVHSNFTWSYSLCIHVYLTTMLWARLSPIERSLIRH